MTLSKFSEHITKFGQQNRLARWLTDEERVCDFSKISNISILKIVITIKLRQQVSGKELELDLANKHFGNNLIIA